MAVAGPSRAIVVDGVFNQAARREAFLRAADEKRLRLLEVFLDAPADVLLHRVTMVRGTPTAMSTIMPQVRWPPSSRRRFTPMAAAARTVMGPLGAGQPVTWGSLLAMGFVGGFLPSPSAVVVLLGAISLGRSWFGVLLVVAYGAGMAATLTGAGLLLLHARDALERCFSKVRRSWLAHVGRLVPVGTAVVILGVGAYLSLRAAVLI